MLCSPKNDHGDTTGIPWQLGMPSIEVITNLDIDTWKETQRSQGMAKCGCAEVVFVLLDREVYEPL